MWKLYWSLLHCQINNYMVISKLEDFIGGTVMSIKIEMIPIITYGVSDKSVILVNNVPYTPKKSETGLHKLIQQTFTKLAFTPYNPNGGVTKVTAFSRIIIKNPENILQIAELDPFYYSDKYGNHLYEDMEPSTVEKVRVVISLITWLKNKNSRFKENVSLLHAMRTCVLCGTVQNGSIVGTNNIPPCKPIPSWPSNYCFNPDCLSHEIEKMIDPKYEVPKVTHNTMNELKEMGLPGF